MRRPAVRLALFAIASTLLAACADVSPTGPSAPRFDAARSSTSADSALLAEWQGSQN